MNAKKACLLALALALCGCGGGAPRPVTVPVMVPPQIDLKPHEVIGVIQFGSTAKGNLGPLATSRFTEAARRDQGLVRIVDLGPEDAALRSVGRDHLDRDAMIALGRKHAVKTLLVGSLTVSTARPDIQVDTLLQSGGLTAKVDATLAVQLVEAESGASLWNGSARATESVGHVSLWGGKEIAFDAADPQRAYGGLVDDLVNQVTRPFRASWERR